MPKGTATARDSSHLGATAFFSRPESVFSGLLLLFLGAALLAGSACWVRATNGELPVSHLVFARCAVFLIFLLPWAMRNRTAARGNNRPWLLIQAVAYTAFLYLYVEGLLLLPVSISTLLSGTGPLWVVCLLWVLFALPPIATQLVAMLVVIGGIMVVLDPEGSYGISNLDGLGLTAATGAGVASAVAFIGFGRLGATDSPHTINLWLSVMGAAISLPILLTSPVPTSASVVVKAFFYGAFALVGQTLLIRATRVLSPEAGTTGNSLIPAFAALLGWIFFSEALSWLEMLGIAIVVAGAVAVSLIAARHKRPQDLPFRWQHI